MSSADLLQPGFVRLRSRHSVQYILFYDFGSLREIGPVRNGPIVFVLFIGVRTDSLEEQRLSTHLNFDRSDCPAIGTNVAQLDVEGAALVEMPQQATCEFHFTGEST